MQGGGADLATTSALAPGSAGTLVRAPAALQTRAAQKCTCAHRAARKPAGLSPLPSAQQVNASDLKTDAQGGGADLAAAPAPGPAGTPVRPPNKPRCTRAEQIVAAQVAQVHLSAHSHC